MFCLVFSPRNFFFCSYCHLQLGEYIYQNQFNLNLRRKLHLQCGSPIVIIQILNLSICVLNTCISESIYSSTTTISSALTSTCTKTTYVFSHSLNLETQRASTCQHNDTHISYSTPLLPTSISRSPSAIVPPTSGDCCLLLYLNLVDVIPSFFILIT